jgi:hypothetical protein
LEAMTWQTLDIDFDTAGQCNYTIYPQSAVFGAEGGAGSIDVTADYGCAWTASSDADWIAVASGDSGSGDGTVQYEAEPNAGAARTGAVTVQNRTLVVKQSGTGSEVNLLNNPGFEEGDNGVWANSGNIIFRAPCFSYGGIDCANEGEFMAWLGGYDNARDYASQILDVPSDATAVSLSFMYAVETEENPSGIYDFMDATVERTRDGYSRTLAKFGNPDATNGWTRSANHDLSEFRGESVRISFDCRTDGSLKTNFYLDDLRLMATMPSANDAVWKGMDENWNNSDNWSGKSVPNAKSNVLIPSSPVGGDFPAIGGSTEARAGTLADASAGSLTIGGSLTIEEGRIVVGGP